MNRDKPNYLPIFRYLDFDYLKEVGEVMVGGEKKHGFESFKRYKPEDYDEVKKAMLRHITAYLKGENNDEETGLSHLCHATCNLMFLYYFDHLEVTQ